MTERRLWFSLGLVAALAVILSAYYFVHKPVTPAQAAALGSALADAGVAGLLTLLGGGLGRRLLRGWIVPSPGERLAVHAALGWGVMGLVMLGLGVLGLYYSVLTWALALLGLLALWRDVRGWLADVLYALQAVWLPDRAARLAGLFVLFTLGLGLLQALAPPLKWDALVYHLTLPKLYAQAHGIRLDADFFFIGMPQLTEMLYAAAILLRGVVAAQTLGWAFGAVLALGLAAHASERLGARLAAFAPAILFSSFTIAISLAWAYVDLLLMLLALACLITLRQWRWDQEVPWLWLSGLLAGFAVGCKYTGAIVPLASAVVIGLHSLVSSRPPPESSSLEPPILNSQFSIRNSQFAILNSQFSIRNSQFAILNSYLSLRHLLWFAFLSLLTFSPWLVKNWLFTGSPTYPLLFPAGHVDALRQWFYNRPDLTERNPLWAALVFLRAEFLGVQGGNRYEATLGPLFVILLLALLLGWHRLEAPHRRELWPLAVFALVSYVAWVALTFLSAFAVQARLFFGIFPALALLCAGGLAAISAFDSPRLRVSLIVNAALVLVLGLGALEHLMDFVTHNPLPYLAGQQSASDYRTANLGWYVVALDRVNALPAGSHVTFLWEARSLDCALPDGCDPDVIIDRWWHLRRTVGTARAILSGWKAQGVTHVLIYDAGVDFVRAQADAPFVDSDWAELDALRQQMRLVEDFGGVYSLYALP